VGLPRMWGVAPVKKSGSNVLLSDPCWPEAVPLEVSVASDGCGVDTAFTSQIGIWPGG